MAPKDRRREVRLSAKDEDLIVEAASLVGVAVTELLVDRALFAAERIVDEHHTIQLGETAYARFLEALDQPVSVPPELLEQAARAARLMHVERLSPARSELIAQAHASVRISRPFVWGRRSVALEHLPAAPAGQAHQVAFVASEG